MRFGISIPNGFTDIRLLCDVAREAEASGWDGFFLWDHINAFDDDTIDPWIALAAIATSTSRIRIGTMVTPLARRRPWIVARQAVTLDLLSAGRVILGVGLGYPPDKEFVDLGEDGDERVRAEKLDESLAIIDGLWSGERFLVRGQALPHRRRAVCAAAGSAAADSDLGRRHVADPAAVPAGGAMGRRVPDQGGPRCALG